MFMNFPSNAKFWLALDRNRMSEFEYEWSDKRETEKKKVWKKWMIWYGEWGKAMGKSVEASCRQVGPNHVYMTVRWPPLSIIIWIETLKQCCKIHILPSQTFPLH